MKEYLAHKASRQIKSLELIRLMSEKCQSPDRHSNLSMTKNMSLRERRLVMNKELTQLQGPGSASNHPFSGLNNFEKYLRQGLDSDSDSNLSLF